MNSIKTFIRKNEATAWVIGFSIIGTACWAATVAIASLVETFC